MAPGSKYNTDTTVGPGQQTSAGYSPQTAGIANLNAAFGGNANAAAMSQAIQQLYAANPQITPAQVAQIVQANAQTANAYYNPDTTADKIFGDLALAGSLAGISLASGGILAGPVAAAAGGGVAGGIAGGATAGAVSGALGSALQGQNIGKGALLGAAGGAIGGAAKPLTADLTAAGVPSPISSGLVKAGTGALTNSLNGGNPLVGAVAGGVSGAVSGANTSLGGNALTGAVAGAGGSFLTGALTSAVGGSNSGSTPNSAQGNIGNMAATSAGSAVNPSTDTSLASTITGALPGVLQGAAGVYGAQNAAQAQQTADNSAINTQQTALGNINGIWGTQAQTGQGANTALQSSLGLNGQPADPSAFLNMPGYQFAVQQGTQAIQRQASALGNAYTPNTSEAIGQYVTGTASQDYNTYIQQLMGAAGLGTTANQGLQTGQQTTANNISTLQQNIGQAQASGVTSAANTIGGVLGGAAGTSLLGAAGNYLGGNGSGVGGANGGSSLTSPFSGTSLANNSGAFNAYNANNGPTAGDISTSTSGAGNINVGDIDTGGIPNVNLPDSTGDSDWLSFLGDGS